MKKRFFTLISVSLLLCCFPTVNAQLKNSYDFTAEQQTKIESLVQDYLRKGISADMAYERAESIIRNENNVSLRSRIAVPPTKSIWIDRDVSNWANYHPVYHAYTEEDLVKKVLLSDATAESAILAVRFTGTWTSTTRSLAYFENGNELGIPSGLLLGTGDILSAEGPNPGNGRLTGGNTAVASDYHLNLISSNLYGGSILEFDFKPYIDNVTFDFIFASEEYPQYSNSNFNDVFGFFVYELGDSTNYTNIALFPNGDPVTINNSNWGQTNGGNNTPAGLPSPLAGAVNPQWHVPNYIDYAGSDSIIEYDGRTIKLTAAANNLDTTKTYTLKLAICNVADNGFGSGVFLSNLDLGSPQGNVETDFDKDGGSGWDTAWDDAAIARNDFYIGCSQTITFNVTASNIDRYMHFDFSPSLMKNYMIINKESFVDSVFVGMQSDLPVSMQFTVGNIPDNMNGVQFSIYSYYSEASTGVIGAERDTTKLRFYKHPTYNINYKAPTTNYGGIFELNISGGTPYLMRSLDRGVTWKLASEAISKSEIYNFSLEDQGYVWLKEPNSCWDTVIPVNSDLGDLTIVRPITVPAVENAILNYSPGIYYIPSMSSFVFTIQPTGPNAGLVPVITTNRTIVPDSEGVIVEDLGNGMYRVTILYIQQPITINIDYTTGNDWINTGTHVWGNNGQLYISTDKNGVVFIYNTTGSLIKTMDIYAGETVNALLPGGFYIVSINNRSYKVALR